MNPLWTPISLLPYEPSMDPLFPYGFPMDLLLTLYGPPMNPLGPPMDPYGCPMDPLWTPPFLPPYGPLGPPMEPIWTPNDSPMDGPPMEPIWTPMDLHMDPYGPLSLGPAGCSGGAPAAGGSHTGPLGAMITRSRSPLSEPALIRSRPNHPNNLNNPNHPHNI